MNDGKKNECFHTLCFKLYRKKLCQSAG